MIKWQCLNNLSCHVYREHRGSSQPLGAILNIPLFVDSSHVRPVHFCHPCPFPIPVPYLSSWSLLPRKPPPTFMLSFAVWSMSLASWVSKGGAYFLEQRWCINGYSTTEMTPLPLTTPNCQQILWRVEPLRSFSRTWIDVGSHPMGVFTRQPV